MASDWLPWPVRLHLSNSLLVEETRNLCPANELSLRLGARKAAQTKNPCATLRGTQRKVNSFHRKHLSVSLRFIPDVSDSSRILESRIVQDVIDCFVLPIKCAMV